MVHRTDYEAQQGRDDMPCAGKSRDVHAMVGYVLRGTLWLLLVLLVISLAARYAFQKRAEKQTTQPEPVSPDSFQAQGYESLSDQPKLCMGR